MRIVQLIDSLEAGGAERMAVNYANSLSGKIAFSGLIATRKEGILKSQLKDGVSYLFLKKQQALDLKALLRLRQFLKKNDVAFVHAHGSSFFIAVLLKFVLPSIKIIWHDHNGNRNNQKKSSNKALRLCSCFFDSILVVNKDLEQWAKKNLATQKVLYVPNFTIQDDKEKQQTVLRGEEGKRIVCLSNLRHPKNHLTMVTAFSNSHLSKKGWTLHFIGKDYLDEYSNALKKCIFEKNVDQSVFLYGSCSDIFFILKQATIGVLGSYYEGFPVVLLEYGLSGLAVISTNAGYCRQIICPNVNGMLFDPKSTSALEHCFTALCESERLRGAYGKELRREVLEKYSATAVINTIIQHYESL